MLKTLTAIGVALALVGPAHAEEQVVIQLAGKSPSGIRSEIHRAVERVCVDSSSPLSPFEMDSCLRDTTDAAFEQLRHARGVYASAARIGN